MNTMYLEMGLFNIALVITVLFQIFPDRKKYRDSVLFCRLLIAIICILAIDTIGWVIDGHPIGGQIWITTVIDGMNLLFTSIACWCWAQYTRCMIDEKKQLNRKWYQDFLSLLLAIQLILVCTSQLFHFYYYVDAAGIYHRGRGYSIHVIISLFFLFYSTVKCFYAYRKEQNTEKKKELLFVSLIILIPIAGNIFQMFVYGFPTVWLCMVFMILVTFIHIQNKRVNMERQKQDAELEKALMQAKAANHAKTDFLSRMSHDLRTPMNAIIGLSALTIDDAANPDIVCENMAKMRQASDFMLGLINDILDMAKIEDGSVKLSMEPYAYNDFLTNMKTMFVPQCEAKGIEVHFAETELNPVGITDIIRINQIFFNIFSNAVKYTPTGGKIDCYIQNKKLEGRIISGDYVIKDTGIGMSKEFQSHLFEPFMQEDSEVTPELQGSGLGLSITKQLVELMGGSIKVESEQGKGTSVIVHLSFELADMNKKVSEEKNKAEDHVSILAGKKVLLAEDHPLNAQIARKLLEKINMQVTYAENGKIAIDKFQASDLHTFDVILMDIRMPEKDGLQAAKEIRQLDREDASSVIIIAMSANAYSDDVQKSLQAGMNGHLAKPVDPSVLYETIGKLLA